MIALVTGSTGFLGAHLVERLVRDGHEVRCLVRKTSDRRALSEIADRVRWVEGDLDANHRDERALAEALADVEVVFHCGGATRKVKPDPAVLFRVNEGGTADLVTACVRHAPKLERFVYVSTAAAMGPAPAGVMLDEARPCRPISDYGRSKLGGERVAFASELPVTALRPPAIYGPRDVNALQLLRMASRGLRPTSARLVNFLHSDDCVEALLVLARAKEAVGRAFLAGGENVSVTGLGEAAAEAVGRRALPLWTPSPVLFGAAAVGEVVGAITGRPPTLYLEKARELSSDWALSSARLSRLGWTPRRQLGEGLMDLAGWYRRHGWLQPSR